MGIMARMATTARSPRPGRPSQTRALLNKVPEVTIWFWVIKILCTTVGESFADWVSIDLGVGLINTTLIFTVVLAAMLTWQMRLPKYDPFSYWLTVVVLSVTGTLYTDILTDEQNVSLAVTTPVFAGLLAVVFGIWYSREHTLSIHSIVTLPREAFYWLAILVTFALGTAAGDWTLQLTGWSPGVSVLLPTFLILAVVVGWRLGANPVLSFWLAYILTRPLGANLGDWLALSKAEGGINLGTALTSVIFLVAILATVTYLFIKRPDVTENPTTPQSEAGRDPKRERVMLGYYGAVAAVAIAVLAVANSRPHTQPAADEATSAPATVLSSQQVTAKFPAADVSNLRTIAQDSLDFVTKGDQTGAKKRITDLETTWDTSVSRLQPLDKSSWTYLDGEIDAVLTSVRAPKPAVATEQRALGDLITSLTP
jgi:uncharacterized membrane-anchored protein